MSTDELLQVWAQRYLDRYKLPYPEDGTFRVSDDSTIDGGCDTCGHGGETYYRLYIGVTPPEGGRGTYAYHSVEIGFRALLDEIQALREELSI